MVLVVESKVGRRGGSQKPNSEKSFLRLIFLVVGSVAGYVASNSNLSFWASVLSNYELANSTEGAYR